MKKSKFTETQIVSSLKQANASLLSAFQRLRPPEGLESLLSTRSVVMANLSQQVHELADRLGPDSTWDDVIEQARFRKAVQEGVAAADRGEFASDEDVRRAFAKWGADVAG
jgi:predicted transcriptional regulator